MGVRQVESDLPGQVARIGKDDLYFDPSEPSLVDSSQKGESDINLIVARYLKTGVLPESARAAAARYGDFSSVPSFGEMLMKIEAAKEVFAALPAQVRREFDNDPALFVAAADTPEGVARLVELGLGEPAVRGPAEPGSAPPKEASPSPASPPAKKGAKAPKVEPDDQE